MIKRILIMAGGTGGHIFPGLAVAESLRDAGVDVHWLGTKDRMESEIVPKHGFPIHFIAIKGFRGKALLNKCTTPFKVLWATLQALVVLHKFKPCIVLGMGGYASGPGALACVLMRIPLVIHEQNAIFGTTNKILNRVSTKTLCAFPNTDPVAAVVGNPVREEILKVPPAEPYDKGRPLRLLVLGGSLGAKHLNEVVPAAIRQLAFPVDVLHQTGVATESFAREQYQGLANAKVTAFIEDMARAYQWADLVICRAGAMTVFEVLAVARPCIFVPYPYAIDDHQTCNARYLVDAGAALLASESKLTSAYLSELLSSLRNDASRLTSMAKAAQALNSPLAVEKIIKILQETADA